MIGRAVGRELERCRPPLCLARRALARTHRNGGDASVVCRHRRRRRRQQLRRRPQKTEEKSRSLARMALGRGDDNTCAFERTTNDRYKVARSLARPAGRAAPEICLPSARARPDEPNATTMRPQRPASYRRGPRRVYMCDNGPHRRTIRCPSAAAAHNERVWRSFNDRAARDVPSLGLAAAAAAAAATVAPSGPGSRWKRILGGRRAGANNAIRLSSLHHRPKLNR